MRTIDGDQAFRLLTDQLDKETGAYSKGRNAGLNVARSMMNNAQALPTLTLNTLRDAMMSVALRYPDIVMHIHDEMVVEVPTKGAELALRDISEIMGDPIPWAPGLLLRGDGYLCSFYQKD